MAKISTQLNSEVTAFLNELKHPLRDEIEQLRNSILGANSKLEENIKWNGPNYTCNKEDRITMKIQPPRQLQLIFHRGAKVQKQPAEKLISDTSGLLVWRENDRAIASFKTMAEITSHKAALQKIVNDWLKATS